MEPRRHPVEDMPVDDIARVLERKNQEIIELEAALAAARCEYTAILGHHRSRYRFELREEAPQGH